MDEETFYSGCKNIALHHGCRNIARSMQEHCSVDAGTLFRGCRNIVQWRQENFTVDPRTLHCGCRNIALWMHEDCAVDIAIQVWSHYTYQKTRSTLTRREICHKRMDIVRVKFYLFGIKLSSKHTLFVVNSLFGKNVFSNKAKLEKSWVNRVYGWKLR